MNQGELEQTVRNIDTRVARIEQILPTLSTEEQLSEAVARLATKEELQAAIAVLATKEELQAAIALLPTREEMHAAIRAEGDAARRHATMLFEDLRDDNRVMLEHLVALSARVDQLARG